MTRPMNKKNLRGSGHQAQRGQFDGGSARTVDGMCICGDCRACRLAMKDIDRVLGFRSRLGDQ